MVKFAARETKGKTSCPQGILSVLIVGISILISDRRGLCYSLRELEKDIERRTNISLVTS